jgi:hypothetical protein
VRVAPAASDQVSMPTQQRLWPDNSPCQPGWGSSRPAQPTLGRPSRAEAGSPAASTATSDRSISSSASWRPSFVPVAQATAVPGRTVDTAVGRSWTDHRGRIASPANPQLRTHDRLSGTHRVRAALEPEEPDYAAAAQLGPAVPHLQTLIQGDDPMLASKASYLASLIQGRAHARPDSSGRPA